MLQGHLINRSSDLSLPERSEHAHSFQAGKRIESEAVPKTQGGSELKCEKARLEGLPERRASSSPGLEYRPRVDHYMSMPVYLVEQETDMVNYFAALSTISRATGWLSK